jgi:hypothetical protein
MNRVRCSTHDAGDVAGGEIVWSFGLEVCGRVGLSEGSSKRDQGGQ